MKASPAYYVYFIDRNSRVYQSRYSVNAVPKHDMIYSRFQEKGYELCASSNLLTFEAYLTYMIL